MRSACESLADAIVRCGLLLQWQACNHAALGVTSNDTAAGDPVKVAAKDIEDILVPVCCSVCKQCSALHGTLLQASPALANCQRA